MQKPITVQLSKCCLKGIEFVILNYVNFVMDLWGIGKLTLMDMSPNNMKKPFIYYFHNLWKIMPSIIGIDLGTTNSAGATPSLQDAGMLQSQGPEKNG